MKKFTELQENSEINEYEFLIKQIEIIKIKQSPELVKEIKNIIDSISNRAEQMEERISDLEVRMEIEFH